MNDIIGKEQLFGIVKLNEGLATAFRVHGNGSFTAVKVVGNAVARNGVLGQGLYMLTISTISHR